MDNHDDCALILSRRGTYDRKGSLRQIHHRRVEDPSLATESHPAPPNSEAVENNQRINEQTHMAKTPIDIQDNSPDLNSPLSMMSPQHVSRNPAAANTASGSEASDASNDLSLAAQFEDFLNWRSQNNGRPYGLILLGEPSPLTFALEELSENSSPQLHNASEHIRDSSNLEVLQQDIYPPHLDTADIAYLKAKGCFRLPSPRTLNDLVKAYLTCFHPHYSIMNKREVENCHREQKLPWILLHAICFIGATFCDASVIYRSECSSRLNARREYYDKAALLFKVGYDNNKIILLQTAVILSFWGPHMQSFWNPCSWIGFGVTLAISLGIHRSAASSNAPRGDKGLLRRLWWTLVVRDTYCSVLLGRPFRINLVQSDTGVLTVDDFTYESHEDAFYQTRITSLSIILRDIMHCRFGPGGHNLTSETVHGQLDEWHSNLNLALERWKRSASPPFTCSTTLELLYHYYILLLYINNPTTNQQAIFPRVISIQQDILRSAAISIASKAVTLLTKTKVCNLPHELFPAFFVAGIVLFRHMKQDDDLVAHMAQANLDNCRIVLNETHESWDPGHWAMQIFDFLCANREGGSQTTADGIVQPRLGDQMGAQLDGSGDASTSERHSANPDDGLLFGSSWESMMMPEELAGPMGNYLFMPSLFPPDADGWSSSFQPPMC